jgi:hypothetical protein
VSWGNQREQNKGLGSEFGQSLVAVAYVPSESMPGVVVACLWLLNYQFTFMGGLVILLRVSTLA